MVYHNEVVLVSEGLFSGAGMLQTYVFVNSMSCVQALAKSLGVKSVPTFKLIRNKKVVAEVVGAKYDSLVAAIKALTE